MQKMCLQVTLWCNYEFMTFFFERKHKDVTTQILQFTKAAVVPFYFLDYSVAGCQMRGWQMTGKVGKRKSYLHTGTSPESWANNRVTGDKRHTCTQGDTLCQRVNRNINNLYTCTTNTHKHNHGQRHTLIERPRVEVKEQESMRKCKWLDPHLTDTSSQVLKLKVKKRLVLVWLVREKVKEKREKYWNVFLEREGKHNGQIAALKCARQQSKPGKMLQIDFHCPWCYDHLLNMTMSSVVVMCSERLI